MHIFILLVDLSFGMKAGYGIVGNVFAASEHENDAV